MTPWTLDPPASALWVLGLRHGTPCPVYALLGVEPRASYMPGEHSTNRVTSALRSLIDTETCYGAHADLKPSPPSYLNLPKAKFINPHHRFQHLGHTFWLVCSGHLINRHVPEGLGLLQSRQSPSSRVAWWVRWYCVVGWKQSVVFWILALPHPHRAMLSQFPSLSGRWFPSK